MNRRMRNRIVRWMNDHHMHYTNARGLAEGCAQALDLSEECGHSCSPEDLYPLARDYYPEERL
jgi:hypothetical protein